jgi:hypothetical protein
MIRLAAKIFGDCKRGSAELRMPGAAFLSQIFDHPPHPFYVQRVVYEAAITGLGDESRPIELLEMEGEVRAADPNCFSDLTRRKTAWTGPDQKTENREPAFLR